uniref:Uncharacterized protein n=1 Tax=Arion vulgaris TaxID=1028688 RepID=A0A0B6Z265_9EUPU
MTSHECCVDSVEVEAVLPGSSRKEHLLVKFKDVNRQPLTVRDVKRCLLEGCNIDRSHDDYEMVMLISDNVLEKVFADDRQMLEYKDFLHTGTVIFRTKPGVL